MNDDVNWAKLLEIEQASYDKPWSRERFEFEIDQDTATFLTAQTVGFPLAGYLVARLVNDQLCINNLAVHPQARRKGVGRTLLNRAITLADNPVATIAVWENQLDAQLFLKAMGFRVRMIYYLERDLYMMDNSPINNKPKKGNVAIKW